MQKEMSMLDKVPVASWPSRFGEEKEKQKHVSVHIYVRIWK
jgi:hypothetical protein